MGGWSQIRYSLGRSRGQKMRKRVIRRRSSNRRGISLAPSHIYTRAYYGVLVKDYGWHEIKKKLQKRFPYYFFSDDTPFKISSSQKELGKWRELKVLYKETIQERTFKAHYDPINKEWHFFDENGKRVDIIEKLKLTKYERLALKWLDEAWDKYPLPKLTVHSAYGLVRRSYGTKYSRGLEFWLKTLQELERKGLVERDKQNSNIWRIKR